MTNRLEAISGPILQKGLDVAGDMFTEEALRGMTEQAQVRLKEGSEIFAWENFRQNMECVQGRLTDIHFSPNGANGEATVSGTVVLMETPAAERVRTMAKIMGASNDDRPALALMGRGTPSKQKDPDTGEEIHVYEALELTGVAIVPESKKIHRRGR